jgi:NAD-dependent dihydropyrimidine dehydrogenase PreA subunit
MNAKTALAIAAVVALPALGGVGGYFAGPALARADYWVILAARVRAEDEHEIEERTLESEAWRDTGEPRKALFARARAVERTFSRGAALVGVFCGLAAGARLFGLAFPRTEEFYHIRQSACVECGRCFKACPRERARLKALRESAPGDSGSGGEK